MIRGFLLEAARQKREEVEFQLGVMPLRELQARLRDASLPPTLGFAAAINRPGEVGLIAEVKRRSPSRGLIRKDFNLAETVRAYREAGAQAVSVLTDKKFFGGAPEFLATARELTGQPLLRKDFIIHEYQVYESRLLGADALLLIAELLPGGALGEFLALARSLGLEALVETRTAGEVERALLAGATIIGINNRNLHTLEVSISTTLELAGLVNKPGITLVSESGIRTRADVEKLGACGVNAVLVGEALMSAGDLRAAVRQFSGVAVRRAVARA